MKEHAIMIRENIKDRERVEAIEARGAFMLPFMTPNGFASLIAICHSDPLRESWKGKRSEGFGEENR
jgi:hypothetical protein